MISEESCDTKGRSNNCLKISFGLQELQTFELL